MAVEHGGDFGRVDLPLDLLQRAGGVCDRAVALPWLALRRHEHFPGLSGPALDTIHPARGDGVQARSIRHAAGADSHLSDVPDPVLHMAADGVLQDDTDRARGMRADRWRKPPADTGPHHPAA